MKRKNLIFILYVFLLIFSGSEVFADKIAIFNFHYDHGEISFKEQFIKDGFYPDRKLQGSEGYKCVIFDKEGNNVYSFRFELPIKLYTDSVGDEGIDGNVIILNETDFSFVVPYFSGAESLVCFNPSGYEIMNENFERISLSPPKSKTWLWIVLALVCIVFAFILIKSRKRPEANV